MASEVNTSSPVFTQDCIYLWDKIVTFVSLCASGTMIGCSFYGFANLRSSGVDEFYFSVMCLQALGFGVLLLIGEFNFQFIHRVFGFLKLRIGRCLIYLWYGIVMIVWASKYRGVDARWPAYIQGALDLVAAFFQFLSIVVLTRLDANRRKHGLLGRIRIDQNANGQAVVEQI